MVTVITGAFNRAAMGLATLVVAIAAPFANAAETPASPKATPSTGSMTAGGLKAAAVPIKTVKLTVRVINAQRRGSAMDKRIRDIEKLLKPVFNFKSYRLVKEETLTLAYKAEARVPLPFSSPIVKVTQLGRANSKIRLLLRIGTPTVARPEATAMTLTIDEGGTFLHGITLKNQQSFVLAFSAKAE